MVLTRIRKNRAVNSVFCNDEVLNTYPVAVLWTLFYVGSAT